MSLHVWWLTHYIAKIYFYSWTTTLTFWYLCVDTIYIGGAALWVSGLSSGLLWGPKR